MSNTMMAGHLAVNSNAHSHDEGGLSVGRVGMGLLIATESCLLATFWVTYLYYVGKNVNGPYPQDVLESPIAASIILLSSSVTISVALHFLKKNKIALFALLWLVTIIQGALFIYYTGIEWYQLIYHDHLTIATNVFGATFYTLVGAHAFHVIVGLVLLLIILLLTLMGKIRAPQHGRVDLIAWYWHFVDVVWIFVYAAVYIISA